MWNKPDYQTQESSLNDIWHCSVEGLTLKAAALCFPCGKDQMKLFNLESIKPRTRSQQPHSAVPEPIMLTTTSKGSKNKIRG
mgnify:CR=1 FL=1